MYGGVFGLSEVPVGGNFYFCRGDVRGVQAAGDAAGLGEAEISLLEIVGGGNGRLGHGADNGKGGRTKREKDRAYMVILEGLEVERFGLEAGLGLGLERP